MKDLHYDEIEKIMFDKTRKIMSDLVFKLSRKYTGRSQVDIEVALMAQLPYLFAVCSGDVKGKTILDLGCGSDYPLEPIDYDQPWLCRALLELKSNPIGIDVGKNPDDTFKFHRLNLFEEDVLSFIPDNSVDVANARLLFNSPTRMKLYCQIEESKKKCLQEILYPQLERIVKPKGYFIHTHRVDYFFA